MKSNSIILFGAVFVVATLVTSFAFALMTTGQSKAAFVPRLLDFALHYAWAAGVAITAIFWLLSRKAIRAVEPQTPHTPQGE